MRDADKPLHIAVGVIEDTQGRVLISQRKPDCAYAGQWEFPGGKVEAGETVEQALRRELHEELGIDVTVSRPLICFDHRYTDRYVVLDTWRVQRWSGRPESREGQHFAWVAPDDLGRYPLLAANRPITAAVRLPECYLITPEPHPTANFLAELRAALAASVRLCRLRAPSLPDAQYFALARQCIGVARGAGAQLLLDRGADQIESLGAHGLHLRAKELSRYTSRPVPSTLWLAASCHNRKELEAATRIGVDFAVLGPVQPTPSHAGVTPLGWSQFAALKGSLALPVYALGGMQRSDLETAWLHGGQGIAAIRGLWR